MAEVEPEFVNKIRVQSMNLSDLSHRLNYSSNSFGGLVEILDSELKALNFGIEGWVVIEGNARLGYSRSAGKWGLTISEGEEGLWLFSDAPRRLRIAAVPKISDLLTQLMINGNEMLSGIDNARAQLRLTVKAIQVARKSPSR